MTIHKGSTKTTISGAIAGGALLLVVLAPRIGIELDKDVRDLLMGVAGSAVIAFGLMARDFDVTSEGTIAPAAKHSPLAKVAPKKLVAAVKRKRKPAGK